MRYVLVLAMVAAAMGCGKEIGDECIVSSDCSPNGDRQCDISSKKGYCTIQGCDLDTCPSEATCVRFFTGNFQNRSCPTTEDPSIPNECSLDELCSLVGKCVPRSSEVRFCMRTCSGNNDCRDGYECRDVNLMRLHGGEPVQAPGDPVDSSSSRFCAPSLN
ncbi:MAG: hypothetical protein H6Q90_940 [Deltaproteobacteria bacterium]|nr:hypothetical protein [Deltaproteobacteria bacterium]